MAPLPKMDKNAAAIQSMREQGRYDEAMARLLDLLRGGTASPAVQAIAANLLAPKAKGERRGPKAKMPFKWLEIGQEYDELRSDGVTDAEARLILAERHPRGKRTIDKIVAFYNAAVEDNCASQFSAHHGESRN